MNAPHRDDLTPDQAAMASALAAGLNAFQELMAEQGVQPVDAMALIISTQAKELAALDPSATAQFLRLLATYIDAGSLTNFAEAAEHPLMLLRCEHGIRQGAGDVQ